MIVITMRKPRTLTTGVMRTASLSPLCAGPVHVFCQPEKLSLMRKRDDSGIRAGSLLYNDVELDSRFGYYVLDLTGLGQDVEGS